MPFNMTLWDVSGDGLSEIKKTRLDNESRLEDWIEKDFSILDLDLLLLGRQIHTEFGGRVDLLGLDRDGHLVLLELKRDRTPRDVVAQILDYASWARNLTYAELDALCLEYRQKSLSGAFSEFFGESLPDNINTHHKLLIVASEFDDSSERIVEYLVDEYDVDINVIFFSFFQQAEREMLGRAWLVAPGKVQEKAEKRKQVPWSGYWFVNVGESEHRNWDDNRAYGYLAAGQGNKFSRALKNLQVGDKVFAYMKGRGYTGYGEVTKEATMVKDFFVENEDRWLLELPLTAEKPEENSENPELSDWAVGVKWIKTVSRQEAKTFPGVFANQNIVCKLRHEATVDFLEESLVENGLHT
ncbi:hypothetical protein BH20ACT11_BH20ACT11_12540 [soil metagenome]